MEDALEKKLKYAWAQYFQSRTEHIQKMSELHKKIEKINKSSWIPKHFLNNYLEMANELKREISCIICYDSVNKDNVSITLCGHIYCKVCISKINECSVCKKKL